MTNHKVSLVSVWLVCFVFVPTPEFPRWSVWSRVWDRCRPQRCREQENSGAQGGRWESGETLFILWWRVSFRKGKSILLLCFLSGEMSWWGVFFLGWCCLYLRQPNYLLSLALCFSLSAKCPCKCTHLSSSLELHSQLSERRFIDSGEFLVIVSVIKVSDSAKLAVIVQQLGPLTWYQARVLIFLSNSTGLYTLLYHLRFHFLVRTGYCGSVSDVIILKKKTPLT